MLVTRYSIDHIPRVVPRGVASFAWRGAAAAGCGWGKFWADFGIARAELDGTHAETRFRLSPKRTSPFKSVGASVQSTAGSRGVRISLSNAG